MLRNESRFRARALQTLYALEVTGGKLSPSIDGVARLTGQYPLVIDDIEPMIERLRLRLPELDRLAQAAADNWRLERIAIVERNILRLAVFDQHADFIFRAGVSDQMTTFFTELSGSFFHELLEFG